MIERARLIESLHNFRTELDEAEQRAKAALAEADALRKIVEGIEGLVSGGVTQLTISDTGTISRPSLNGNEAVVGDTPRGKEAVRRLFLETRRTWKRRAIIEEVVRRGWIDPEARNPNSAIGASIDRLAKAGELRRHAHATYRYTKLPPLNEEGAGNQLPEGGESG